nr:hypothetical protein [Tanacetum cinerariifolium]
MSIYKVPMAVLRTMKGIRARFFNGADNKVRKSSWVSWNQVMASKNAGGLGVASLFALNRGLMFKWVWRFITQKNSLWAKVITAIHGDDGKIGKIVNPTFPSIWINIIQENDAWRGDVAFKILAPRIYMLESMKDIQILEGCILSDTKDRWTWSLEGSGKFSVSSIRKTIDAAFLPCGNVKTRWVKEVPIKINILAWKVSNDYLPTRFNLSRRVVVDAFIPYKKSKASKRFAFVRFIKVDNIDRHVINLCTIWIGRFHLHANVAHFHREHKPSAPSHPLNVYERNSPEEVNKKVKGATSNEVNEHVNSTSNKLEESVPKGKLSLNNSVCSKRAHTGGSILQLMDELVKNEESQKEEQQQVMVIIAWINRFGVVLPRSVETEFPAIVFNDNLTSNETLFREPTNEFPAIVYNDALTSKSEFSIEPTLCPQHNNEFYLKDETSLSEYDEVEQNILYLNDLFPFNIIYPDDLKSDKNNDDDKIDIIQSSRRHPFLRYQGFEYSDQDIANFKERILMKHRDDDEVVVLTSQVWGRVFETRGTLVRELILEFLSTLRFGEEGDAERVTEEAPMAPGGGDEDDEIPHAVPPPPRIQGERIARLEEEVHGMHKGRCNLHEMFRVTGRVPEAQR